MSENAGRIRARMHVDVRPRVGADGEWEIFIIMLRDASEGEEGKRGEREKER